MGTFQFNYQYLILLCTVVSILQGSAIVAKKGGGTYRIINGTRSSIKEFPFLVSVQKFESILPSHICGGAFISSDWILTAAHCLKNRLPMNVLIRAESSYHDQGGTLLPVSQLIMHQEFRTEVDDYDYGLIKLSKTFRRAVPANLKKGPRRFRSGELCTVMGWGRTASTSLSKQIQKATVPIVSNKICQDTFLETGDEFTSRMLCAGYQKGGTDACEGDSGGPLVCRRMLTGISSWGLGCAEADYYGVYSDVTPIRAWIRNHTGV
ncbi:trypsin-1-like [Culex pipiens pallens]|uniref:trypsin-1-like n=1 Tax=Culex pipiens pallens TaxID=42434 RepID=UPI0019549E36|nr:trypsin-1-like [Culex pipiens pallens]